MNIIQLLQDKLTAALSGLVDEARLYAAMVKPVRDSRHGDYQANAAMPLAKLLNQPARTLAARIVERIELGEMLEPPVIAGPGFINFRLKSTWLAALVQKLANDGRLGVERVAQPRRFVVDYSSPNVAKPMHVGHLRSTIIGDAIARLLRFLGHFVIADNHLGDWGTQFGMLIYGYKHYRDEAALAADPVREMGRLYLLVRQKIREAGGGEDEEDAVNPVAEACRRETAKLHAGDPENTALWTRMMPWCLAELERVYRRLDVRFDYTLGESFYNPVLPAIVNDLLARGIAEISDGAVVVFHSKEVDDDGRLKVAPSMIRKRDGGFTYMTTDLATIRHRVQQFHADAILYIVGFPQQLHFQHLFDIARRWGYTHVALEHVVFGSVLGQDRKIFRTREGGVIELDALLDEAVARARQIVDANSPELPQSARQEIAEAVGLGAVKYADLSQNRTSDYLFSWDKMLAMDGNTATYMQYAYARVQSIFRKGEVDVGDLRRSSPAVVLEHPSERALALALVRLPEVLNDAAAEYKPNLITAYLWDLANAYSSFFQNCPVLKAEPAGRRLSRLVLCDLTARAIHMGLDLLGIRTPHRM